MDGMDHFCEQVEEVACFPALLANWENSSCDEQVWMVQAIHQPRHHNRAQGASWAVRPPGLLLGCQLHIKLEKTALCIFSYPGWAGWLWTLDELQKEGKHWRPFPATCLQAVVENQVAFRGSSCKPVWDLIFLKILSPHKWQSNLNKIVKLLRRLNYP